MVISPYNKNTQTFTNFQGQSPNGNWESTHAQQTIIILNKSDTAYADHFGYIKDSTYKDSIKTVPIIETTGILPNYNNALVLQNPNPYRKKQGLLDFVYSLWGGKRPPKAPKPPKQETIITNYNTTYSTKSPNRLTAYDEERKSKIKKWIIGGVVLGGLAYGAYAIKKNGIIENLIKKFDGKTETIEKGKPVRVKSKNVNSFNTYCNKLLSSSNAPLEDYKIIMRNEDLETKKETLSNLFQAQKIYCDREVQPKINLIMSEKVKDEAPAIADYFAKNRIDELPDYYLKEIEGFKIVGRNNRKFDRSELLVIPEVRTSTNGGVGQDIVEKYGKDIKNRITDML